MWRPSNSGIKIWHIRFHTDSCQGQCGDIATRFSSNGEATFGGEIGKCLDRTCLPEFKRQVTLPMSHRRPGGRSRSIDTSGCQRCVGHSFPRASGACISNCSCRTREISNGRDHHHFDPTDDGTGDQNSRGPQDRADWKGSFAALLELQGDFQIGIASIWQRKSQGLASGREFLCERGYSFPTQRNDNMSEPDGAIAWFNRECAIFEGSTNFFLKIYDSFSGLPFSRWGDSVCFLNGLPMGLGQWIAGLNDEWFTRDLGCTQREEAPSFLRLCFGKWFQHCSTGTDWQHLFLPCGRTDTGYISEMAQYLFVTMFLTPLLALVIVCWGMELCHFVRAPLSFLDGGGGQRSLFLQLHYCSLLHGLIYTLVRVMLECGDVKLEDDAMASAEWGVHILAAIQKGFFLAFCFVTWGFDWWIRVVSFPTKMFFPFVEGGKSHLFRSIRNQVDENGSSCFDCVYLHFDRGQQLDYAQFGS